MELALQENGNFLATPDTRRLLVNLQYNTSDHQLEWEWYDRREKKVLDTILETVTNSDDKKVDFLEVTKHQLFPMLDEAMCELQGVHIDKMDEGTRTVSRKIS